MGRLIIVSNRLPFRLEQRKGKVTQITSSGGLVSSIRSFLASSGNSQETVWIGSPDGSEKQFRNFFASGDARMDEFKVHPVFLPALTKDRFYNGFCNSVIWPLFHYFPSYVKINDADYGHYLIANNLFFEKVAEVYRPGDTIWIHDYHLMTLPALLRAQFPMTSIGFFLHIPFPSFELFRLLPKRWRLDILNGLLGADLIGFHTNDYVRYFIHSVRQLLGFESSLGRIITENRRVLVEAYPVSIDVNKFHSALQSQEVLEERNRIRKGLEQKKIILSVDRLDYSKGIITRLEAFDWFLEKNPGYRGKITYLLLVIPSREIISRYSDNKESIEILISRINGKYGTINWVPVNYWYRSVKFSMLAGLYLAADIALITPVRDGMNLVSKEFIASRSDKKGVLILSETAGAAFELSEALQVNPLDKHDIADALFNAIGMSLNEQSDRMELMQERLQRFDVVKWADSFISDIGLIKKEQEQFQVKVLNHSSKAVLRARFLESKNRLIFLDYDGTLTPLAKLPHLAYPGIELKNLLRRLTDNSANHVVIISGRSKDILHDWLGELNTDLVAEHGAFCRRIPQNWQQMVNSDAGWKGAVIEVMNSFVSRCNGSFVEEKQFSVAWHYRNAERRLGFQRSRELFYRLSQLSVELNFQVMNGHMVIEARERGIDKGTAAQLWLDAEKYDFVLAIGDDRTDEDLFMEVGKRKGITIRVGLKQSVAMYNFRSQEEVLEFLEKIAG